MFVMQVFVTICILGLMHVVTQAECCAQLQLHLLIVTRLMEACMEKC